MPPQDRGGNRPEPFTQNFQRETQAFLFLLQWRAISYSELRRNLKKMGVELEDDALNLPKFPQLNFELPEPEETDAYPNPEAEGEPMVDEAVLGFINDNDIPQETYIGFPVEAFMSLDAFVKALSQNSEVS